MAMFKSWTITLILAAVLFNINVIAQSTFTVFDAIDPSNTNIPSLSIVSAIGTGADGVTTYDEVAVVTQAVTITEPTTTREVTTTLSVTGRLAEGSNRLQFIGNLEGISVSDECSFTGAGDRAVNCVIAAAVGTQTLTTTLRNGILIPVATITQNAVNVQPGSTNGGAAASPNPSQPSGAVKGDNVGMVKGMAIGMSVVVGITSAFSIFM